MDQNFSDNFTTNDDPFSIPNLNLWTWKTILHSFPYKVIPKWRFPNFPFASDLRPQGCRNGSCGSKTPHKQLSTAKKLTQILRLSLMAFFKNLEDANFNSMVRSKNCLLLFGSVPYETTGPRGPSLVFRQLDKLKWEARTARAHSVELGSVSWRILLCWSTGLMNTNKCGG